MTRAVKVRIEGLTKTYQIRRNEELQVFADLNAEIYEHEFVSVIGPSGCGKTTLISMIAGLVRPSSGQVLLDGRKITKPGRDRGVVFQQDAILPWRTVRGNIEYGLSLRRVPKVERLATVARYLDLVRLRRFADFYPKELSGGMKKRTALAAVFANDPEVLLMDEPFGSLDYPSKVALQKALLDIWEQARKTTIFITHDLEEAIVLSDRIFALRDGTFARVVDVPFDRPRNDELRGSPEFQSLKQDLWDYLSAGSRDGA
jgi:NitT/TauT family transport system ATP-binding protein